MWEPIETAPKDETRVLLTDGKHVSVGSFYLEWDKESEILYEYGDVCHATWHPTHWQQLPEPPVSVTMRP